MSSTLITGPCFYTLRHPFEDLIKSPVVLSFKIFQIVVQENKILILLFLGPPASVFSNQLPSSSSRFLLIIGQGGVVFCLLERRRTDNLTLWKTFSWKQMHHYKNIIDYLHIPVYLKQNRGYNPNSERFWKNFTFLWWVWIK